MNTKPSEYGLVQSQRDLDEIRERLSGAGQIALDTEFVRERTYYPELCLLQIATDDTIAAIDCLADIDLGAFFEALLADERGWILHSARQDLEVLFHQTETLPKLLIDTQIAASLLGFPMQVGLQSLVEEVLEVKIGKEHTRTNWSKRPLAAAALEYALDDVRYLMPLWQALQSRLEQLDRLAWFEEDCVRQLEIPIFPDARSILERTKGAGSLRGNRRAAALALIAWREARAQKADRPRRWILPDDQLVTIASRLPASVEQLAGLPGLAEKTVRRSGNAMLAAMAAAERVDDTPTPPPPEKEVVKAMQAEVRLRAEALGIQSEVLATRRDVSAAASGRPPASISGGWRGKVLADLGDRFSQARES